MSMGYIGNRTQDVMGYRGYRHKGNRVQGVRGTGVWGTWAMGHIGIIMLDLDLDVKI